MNETLSHSNATAAKAASSRSSAVTWHQRAVLRAFSAMTRGHLQIHLPDGSLWQVGQPGAAVSAIMRVRSTAFFEKCVLFGDIGFGEAYVDGDWETDSIERVIQWAILNIDHSPGLSGSRIRAGLLNLFQIANRVGHWLRPNSIATSKRNIAEHYDLGNSFYELWLDRTMTYSSALFSSASQPLEDAQSAKYDALCRKLQLKPTDHVLEIGSGWGGFCTHAARHYGCRVTTITISERQCEYARERVRREGLADRIEVRLQDYRLVEGSFDKVVSIEMMEALGDRYLDAYFQKIHEVLAPHGLVALQYITVPDSRHAELRRGVDWIQKHIFPGSLLLSVGRVNESLQRTGDLFLHDLEDLGASYAKTLHLWWERFNAQHAAVTALGFGESFIRKWNYYLQYCEAAFASRNISVVQAVYTRPNNAALHTEFAPPTRS